MKKIFTFLKVFVYTLGFSQGVQIVNPNEGNSVYPSEQYFCEGESFDLKVDAVVSSTGDRSAKIKTYNYPQGRVTDHRINKSIYNLDAYMNGDIQEMMDAVIMAENAEKMKGQEEI